MEATGVTGTLGRAAVSVSTALVLVAIGVLPFLSPAWVAFEQGRVEAGAWTGYAEPDLRAATNAILADLVLGPPDFDVEVAGVPVLTEPEREHMRDVRGVFAGFYAAATVALVVLVVAARRLDGHARWRAIRRGATGLVAGIVVAGVLATVAFDLAFEVFHRLFFSAGSYTFDPRTDRLVQLFPERFWFETTIAVGAVVTVLAATMALVASRRLRSAAAPDMAVASAPSGSATTIEPGAAR